MTDTKAGKGKQPSPLWKVHDRIMRQIDEKLQKEQDERVI